jgi:tRNA pseudouridine38-40 synthase
MKIALKVAYDGTQFHGFAKQRNQRSVQGDLEISLSTLLRTPVTTVGAGRTDAGVHASHQVVSFEAPEGTEPEWVLKRLNKMLAPEVVALAAAAVLEDFSARFSATRRAYEYRIYRSAVADPFRDRFAWWVPDKLSFPKMRAAARPLIGEHDFSSFCRRGEGSMVRQMRAIRFVSNGDELTVKVVADSFCHQMVRAIVGTLMEIGAGKRDADSVAPALAARDRARAGAIAPARGLHLVDVVYRPDPFR